MRISLRFILISFILIVLSQNAFTQSVDVIMNSGSNGTTTNSCGGGLYDSGGNGSGGPYGNNENITVTICPDTPGLGVSLFWVIFSLDCTNNLAPPATDADSISIYDGDNTGAPLIGTYHCGDLSTGSITTASLGNPTGCLTVVFNSNGTGTGDFYADISCEVPCDPPSAQGIILNADNAQGDSIAVCVNEIVDFNDNGSTAGSSGLFTLDQWVWHWFDGSPDDTLTTPTQVSHSFSQPGQYIVQLEVIDDNGCSNTNTTDLAVYVTTYPSFDPFPNDTSLCVGESLDLQAYPDAYEVEWSGFPVSVNVPDNCMEDNLINPGVQQTPMTISGYDSNIQLNSGNPDILSICVEMEHSYLGDFVLQVQCPTGQVMTLHQQGGGGTYLGIPEDYQIDCTDPSTFGVPYTYCFTPTATQTWVDASITNSTIPPGDYAPIDVNGFAALDGCPINGTWNLLFTDMWGIDDGSIPSWSINFDSSLDPPVTSYTPDIGSGSDSSYWDISDPWITSSSADLNQISITPGAAGAFNYTFTAINSFGCSFDSTITVDVYQSAIADVLDTSLCDALNPIQLNAGSAACEYTITMTDTYGDGWNGGYLEVTTMSGTTTYTLPTGSNGSATFTVPVGNNFSIQWIPGSWLNEVGYVVTDPGGGNILVHNPGTNPPTNINNFVADCPGNEIYVPLAGYTYIWTPPTDLNNPNIPDPISSATSTTTYVLTMYPTGHPDCAQTDTMTIFIGGGLDAGTDSSVIFCFEGAPEDLFNYLGGTPQTGGTWYNPAGQAISMPIQPDTIANGLYEYVKDSAGCQVSAFVDVLVHQITGTTSVTNSDCQACNGEIQLICLDGMGPLQYSNDAGTTFQTGDTFTGLCGSVSPGVNYSFVIMDSIGCVVTVDDFVEDINAPTLDPVVYSDASCYTVCDGAITLSGTNIVDYSIDNGSTFQSTGSFNALCPGTYDIVVDNGSGCQVIDQVIIVEPSPLQIDFISPDMVICPGLITTVEANGSGGNGNYTFDWESSGNNLGSGESLDITVSGNMLVCVTMSEDCPSPTVTQCLNITQPGAVYPLMTSDITNGCKEDPVTVTFDNLTAYPNIATTLWTFSDGTQILANGNNPVSHTFTEAGVYDVMMTITTIEGCVHDTTFSQYIEVYAHPTAMFSSAPIPATIYDTEINFTNFSTDDVTQWNWSFSGGMPASSNDPNPTVLYPEGEPGDYPVMLYVWNDNNCIDSVYGMVNIVNDVVIYAPNVITPDGDEFNEGWRVWITGIDIYDYHCMIYNRWGELVWESYNSESYWMGNYSDNGLVQDGTYIWVVEAKDSYTDKRYEFRGHVTVLK